MIKAPNKADSKFNSDKSYPPLPSDDYQLKILSFEEKKKPKYKDPSVIEDVVTFSLEVMGFKDGSPAIDSEKGQANGRRLWFDFYPNKLLFTSADLPSISRQFLGYAMMVEDLEQDFELNDYNDLVGKVVFAQVILKTNTQQKKVNRIVRFLKPARPRGT